MPNRARITDFTYFNSAYINATVAFYLTDEAGTRTETLAPLYAGLTGSTQVENPQRLGSRGKFTAAVYHEAPIIGVVESMGEPSHETGVIHPIEKYAETVAGISAEIQTVAGISDDVETVAGISADVSTVAGISADVEAVANISDDVQTVAGVADEFGTLASIATQAAASETSAAASEADAEAHRNTIIAMGVAYAGDITSRIAPQPCWDSFAYDGQEILLPDTTFARSSTAIAVNHRGLYESTSADTIRIQYDIQTKGLLGWLIEGSRTNYVTYARYPSNADWSKVRASVTSNAIADLFGGTTGEKIVEDSTASASHYVFSKGFTVTSGEEWCFWAVFEKAERDYVWIDFSDTCFGSASICYFDLNTGSVSSQQSGIDDAGVIDLGDGRYLCWAVDTATATGTANLVIGPAAVNGATAYNGDGSSGVYFLGGQAEKGAYPTSFIDTAATAVTRAADQLSADLSDTGITTDGSKRITLCGERRVTLNSNSALPEQYLRLEGASSANLLTFYYNPSDATLKVAVTAGGVSTAFFGTAALPDMSKVDLRYAVEVAEDYYAFSLAIAGYDLGNGSGAARSYGPDTSGAFPTGLAAYWAGNNSDLNRPMFGIVGRDLFYDVGLGQSNRETLIAFP